MQRSAWERFYATNVAISIHLCYRKCQPNCIWNLLNVSVLTIHLICLFKFKGTYFVRPRKTIAYLITLSLLYCFRTFAFIHMFHFIDKTCNWLTSHCITHQTAKHLHFINKTINICTIYLIFILLCSKVVNCIWNDGAQLASECDEWTRFARLNFVYIFKVHNFMASFAGCTSICQFDEIGA